MFATIYLITGVIVFLLIEVRNLLEEDFTLVEFAGNLCFGLGGYMLAWPYCLYFIVMEECDESEED